MTRKLLICMAPWLLLLGACGSSEDTSSSDTAASTVSDAPQLTFDGSDCDYEGPEEVTAGVVAVELANDSDGTANIAVLLLDEGKTVQDMIDDVGPGPATGSPPPWASDMGGQAPARAGESMRWEASLAPGQYVTLCTRSNRAWFGGGLAVVEP